MIRTEAMTDRKLEFDLILDESPAGVQGDALSLLVASGDFIAVRLPYGFVGLRIVHTQTLLYVGAGQLHIKQIIPRAADESPSTAVPVLS